MRLGFLTTVTTITAVLPASAFYVPYAPAGKASRAPQTVMQASSGSRDGPTRRELLQSTGLLAAALLPLIQVAGSAVADDVTTLPSGLSYTVVENGEGPTPKIGELAAIRFKGSYNNVVYDDLFATKEPLYFRVGGGTLLKGIDDVVQLMRVGDRWKVNIPGDLAFGKKGRSASPGKPRIPPMATVEYDLKLVGLPGRETELIDLANFDENAPASDDSVNSPF